MVVTCLRILIFFPNLRKKWLADPRNLKLKLIWPNVSLIYLGSFHEVWPRLRCTFIVIMVLLLAFLGNGIYDVLTLTLCLVL